MIPAHFKIFGFLTLARPSQGASRFAKEKSDEKAPVGRFVPYFGYRSERRRSEQEQQLKLKFCFGEWQAKARTSLSRKFCSSEAGAGYFEAA
jgi:hypothetical protein